MYSVFEQLCQEKGVTSYRVSADTGVSQTTLSRWKNTERDPELQILLKLALYFDTTVDYLVTGEKRTRYYVDDDTARRIIQLYMTHPALFDAATKSKPEDIDLVTDILIRMEKTNPEG